ncbi:arf-GAP domain and FG repeat-containing protein 1 isoform X1 [Rhopalosiphum padi]|uniref:arf-GAP domain and FG repeat-containing protein 1 isoform X1 n=1 Tax=Rhopalosiphum padi TaxID=40932 RepID=UPI00298EA1FB|nr:arf-GAP domain and FG repeat-containing protein 1 isoform X1 [Rhopalosiphum padi]
MANGIKKLDEYNLMVLREQLSLPANKYCFDCHQRGPTYVNVTIGSFVCTSCSGLLRGLTPPHRVKSVSMATFSTEEIDFIKSRGNESCERVWLGMYDSKQPTNDEKQIKDFMVAKYEKKMYYSDQVSQKLTNGIQTRPFVTTITTNHQNPSTTTTPAINISSSNKFEFFKEEPSNQNQSPIQTSQSFANFENNPVFSTSFDTSKNIDLNFKFVQPLQTGYFDYLTSNPIQFSPARKPNNINNRWSVAIESTSPSTSWKSNGAPSQGPTEDRYAALKDLDCLMKSQVQQDTPPQLNNSNSSAWSSDASLNGTWSSQVSENTPQNPFKNSVQDDWASSNNVVNPFSNNISDDWQNNIQWPNGLTSSQSMGFNDVTPWNADFSNPFKVGSASPLNKHSSNPFL